jgi:hypothetical protein
MSTGTEGSAYDFGKARTSRRWWSLRGRRGSPFVWTKRFWRGSAVSWGGRRAATIRRGHKGSVDWNHPILDGNSRRIVLEFMRIDGDGPVTDTEKMKNLAAEQLAAISRLFSSSVIRELARRGKSPLFARLAQQSLLFDSVSLRGPVSGLFEAAFSLLKREGYRHEYIYKAALTHNILLGKHSLRRASMLNEFRVGECKADLAILNGTSTVYEVKSERDSLSRLERQVAAYAKVFAQVYVVAAQDHVDAVKGLVSGDVGILLLSRRHHISKSRNAVDRPERTSPAAIFDAIRTEEAQMILRLHGVSVPAVPNTVLNSVLRELFLRLDARKAHDGMVRVLKRTRNLLPLSALVDQLPRSLQTAALSVPLRKQDHTRLVAAVNTRLEDAMGWV